MQIQQHPLKLCLQQVSDRTLRLSLLPVREDFLRVFSALDLAEDFEGRAEDLIAMEDGEYALGRFTVALSGQEIRVRRDGQDVQTLRFSDRGVSFPLGRSHLYGLGHGYTRHPDRRGERYDLRVNGQVQKIVQNYSATSPTGYVIASQGWGLFFHQPWKGAIDLRGEEGLFSVPALLPAWYCDVFLVAFDRMSDAAAEYYRITGLPPMLPRYALGYQQSYRTLVHNGVNEVMRTARYMREHDLPCDLLIYLGTGYCENGWNTENGNFDFHPVAFPEPEETMQALHDMHYKVSLHVTKCHTGLHGRLSDEDVSPLEYDHVRNYWQVHQRLYRTARNESWWPDDADDVDQTARLARHRMYYEGSLQLNPALRPFQMQRNAFPGHTKWGAVVWSGDVMSEWATLKNQVAVGLNASLSCTPWWGTDTGGFFSTKEYTGEMFIRWFQFSAFSPFLRGHGRPSYLHSPYGWSLHRRWEDLPLEGAPGLPRDNPPPQDSLPDDRVEPICREYLHLRYRLLPYLYHLTWEAHDQGLPLMRPLWFDHPEDETCLTLGSQYMLGSALLVAPVTDPGASGWPVYLPEGDWYDFHTGERLHGGGWITAPAPLERIPVYVRAGSILPLSDVRAYIPDTPPEDFDPLTLRIYPGADAQLCLYEDDGCTMAYLEGQCTRTHLRWCDGEQALALSGNSAIFPGRSRVIRVEVVGGAAYDAAIEYDE